MELSLISSSSSSSSVPQQIKHEVFISFRGEDTRNNFTSHLHKALRDKQIQAFVDYELDRGNEISSSLVKAIEESQISVIIFSKNYASSKWCLEELVTILECKRRYAQTIIPVFYQVDPSEVRNQKGTFGDAFTKHEDHFKENLDEVKRWRDALKEAANISGWHSTATELESVLIENVVENILKTLNNMSPSDNKDLIGIDTRIKEIISLLKIGTKDARILGIWGIGGIGKTTLAEAVFHKIFRLFEGSCFIDNVRKESEKGGLSCLRERLFSRVLGDGNMNMGTSITRHTFTMNRLGRKNILIVLDDVSDYSQIEYLMGNPNYLSPQSRIIITSRNKQVFKNCQADQWYEVKELCHYEALVLFCRYAFKGKIPTKDYIELSKRVARYVGGIPLALKVLGSSLLDKGKNFWDDTIGELKKNIDGNIQKVLKISYDELEYKVKKIFLDIAIFFNRKDVGIVKHFFKACGFSYNDRAISILIDKCLIVVLDSDIIIVHDLLQAMAKEIVRKESEDDPRKRSRLWDHEDIYSVFEDNTDTETIEGISLDVSTVKAIKLNPDAFSRMRKLRVLNFYSSCPNKKSRVHVVNELESVFTELKYLHWCEYPFTSISSNFYLQNLTVLEMPNSKVTQLWDGVQVLPNLKKMDFSYSTHLTCIPDLSRAPNLGSLTLRGCTSLIEIPSSIQHLVKLVFLDLGLCANLWKFPASSDSIKELLLYDCSKLKAFPISSSMEVLDLSGTAVEVLPSNFVRLSRLRSLVLNGCSRLTCLPDSICRLTSLEDLSISDCSKLDRLPEELGSLENLRILYAERVPIKKIPSSMSRSKNLGWLSIQISECQEQPSLQSGFHHLNYLYLNNYGFTELPESLGLLSSVQYSTLNGNNFESIPESIIHLSGLFHLNISYCERLQSLPELRRSLCSLYAANCKSLQASSLLSTLPANLTINYMELTFINCFNLNRNAISDIVKNVLLKFLSKECAHHDGTKAIKDISLDVSEVKAIKLNPLAFPKMQKLRVLNFYSSCDYKKSTVHVVTDMESAFNQLKYLYWHEYPLTSLSSNFCLQNLVRIRMPYSNVIQLWDNNVQVLPNLKKMDFSGSRHLTCIPDLSQAPNLESLFLRDCTSLTEIPSSIQHLVKLVTLDLGWCENLWKFPASSDSIKVLTLAGCSKLKAFPIASSMEWLDLSVTAVEVLPSNFERLSRLRSLVLNGCSRLTCLPNSICRLTSLEYLNISNCSKLDRLPDSICRLTSLEYLHISNCSKLDRLPEELGNLENLQELEAVGVPIKKIPSSMSRLKNLRELSIRRPKCQEQPSLQLPPLLEFHHLTYLWLENCGITELPESLGSLSSVTNISLKGNNLESIPASIIHLSRLSVLNISYCERLQSLPELPRSLNSFYADNCKSLQALSNLSTLPANLNFNDVDLSFINCFNLNRNEIRDIVKNVLLKILSKERARGHGAGIKFPGDEIPEWFIYRRLGSLILFKLPPDWFNDAFFGFALCIVVPVCDHIDNHGGLWARFECKVKSPDGESFLLNHDHPLRTRHSVGAWRSLVGADHMLLNLFEVQRGDFGGKYFRDEISFSDEISFRFYLEDNPAGGKPINCCKVKKCGVRLIYKQDFVDSVESFSFDDNGFWKSTEESSTSRRFRFEEEEQKEPDPKTLKLIEFHRILLNNDHRSC